MGNNIKQKITEDYKEMKICINTHNYEKGKEIYLRIRSELIKIKKEGLIMDIIKYLLNKYTNRKTAPEFESLVFNLRPNDKLPFLLQLLYENELVNSVDKNNEIDEKNPMNNDNDENDIENQKEKINKIMKRIYEVNNYVDFYRFKSIMFEEIAEKYFSLGTLIYKNFVKKRNQSLN